MRAVNGLAACRSCGTEPLENARFCHCCGSPIDRAETRAEYKQVTVLFADVVHSMDIAKAVGPERLREIMAGLLDRAATVVKRYGGTLDKFTGDGIMAVFGAPIALEDHALRACRAALDIHSAICDLTDDVTNRDGAQLRLRIGLNSGQVIAGEIGSGGAGYTAIGEQVGLAQRMESVAPPGGVMLSSSTARLVHGVARLGDPELVRIKGADEPVAARRFLGVGVQHRAVRRAESSLVGRRSEMSAVKGLLDRTIRWTWRGSRGGGRTRYRQEPGGTRGRCAGHRPRCRGVLGPLRVTYQPGALPCRGAAAASGYRRAGSRRPNRAGADPGRSLGRKSRGPGAVRGPAGHRQPGNAASGD